MHNDLLFNINFTMNCQPAIELVRTSYAHSDLACALAPVATKYVEPQSPAPDARALLD